MSSSSQPLTSTISELYNLFRDIKADSLSNSSQDIVITPPPSQVGQSVTGRYRYEVHDKQGEVYDSGDWQPNLILNCGLDKLAEMPIAQVFQFAVAGKDVTPNKEPYEESNLTVKLLSSTKCPPPKWAGTECDPAKPKGALIARSCPGNLRMAPDHAMGGTCQQKAFGVSSDIGKLLYLRDLDLQYNIVDSCPVYTEDPVTPDIRILADCSSTLSAAVIPGGTPVDTPIPGTGVVVGSTGVGYMASLSHDTGLPWNQPGGLLVRRQSFDLPSGDCMAPLLCTYSVSADHTQFYDEWRVIEGADYVNPVAGISIELPNMLRPDVIAKANGCALEDTDITVNDPGEGLPFADPAKSCSPVEIIFDMPLDGVNCKLGDTLTCPAAAQPLWSERTQAPGFERGDHNMFNLIRIGAQQIGKFTDPAIVANLPASLQAENCTSFQEYFSKIILFLLFRKEADIAWCSSGLGLTVCQKEYEKLSIDYSQLEGSIPGFFTTYPVGHPSFGSTTPALNHALNNFNGTALVGGSTLAGWFGAAHRGVSNDATNPFEDYRPWHYLPWWLKNTVTSMDTIGAGGSAYVNLFGGTIFNGPWAAFKTAILDTQGIAPTPRAGFTNAAGTGNLFSGIPWGALKDLPDYTYTAVGDIIDFGCGIKSIEPSSFKGGMFTNGNNGTAYDGTSMPNPSHSLCQPTVDVVAEVEKWMEFNITDGRVVGIKFKWSKLYETLTGPTQHASHILADFNDRSLILGLNIDFPTIVYETPRGARGTVNVNPGNGSINTITLTDGGIGYCPGEEPRGRLELPSSRVATVSASTNADGNISTITIIDPGSGYSSVNPAKICFPPPPEPDIISYDLVLDPIDTYESVNTGHWHSKTKLPTPLCYIADIFSVNQTDLFDQYKTHGWYLTGNSPEINTTHCGTDFLSAANQVAMTRTFDFYMELQPVTYGEIGFKESPAACELWSRIALDPPVKLCPGQFLRLAYQLVITFEPGPIPRYKEVPTNGQWYNKQTTTGEYLLTGYECIQGNGIAVVDQYGIAVPYDITGVANEPYAPGSTNLGQQYGYVNRWYNGDLRLSWPTKEYATDNENPWILGGDQVNPPDWAIKFKDNPTVNYRPRDFKSYLETPAQTGQIVNASNASPTVQFRTVNIPPGPELTIERDAFDHWFTRAAPEEANSITWTNFVPSELGGNGRWDFLITKGYVADIYPHLMGKPWIYQNIRNLEWIDRYALGQELPAGAPAARSAPGVFPGPIIEYTGQIGALHDPISVRGQRLTRNVADIMWPYCDRYHMMLLEPNNSTNMVWEEIEWEISYCKDKTRKWKSPEWCSRDFAPYNENVINRTWGLSARNNYYGFGNLINKKPVNEKAGGGFTQIESWMPWTHTPLITSVSDWYLYGDARKRLKPDTAGNWSEAEAIPVAGASGFVSTSDANFAEYGHWVNRSHTISGAVLGADNRPENDYTGPICVEVPTYLEPYRYSTNIAGDHKVKKHAVFETSYANLTGIKCIGLGPTSTTLRPPNMTDSARFNTYVFKFGEVDTAPEYKGMDKLIAYKLDVTFQQTFYRNLKI